MKRLLTPLAAACLLATASTVSAASYSALYIFGDSLSDAGQFPDAGGPANSTQRFTNRTGPTYQPGSGEIRGQTAPMLIGQQLGLGPQTPSTSAVYQSNGWADGNDWAVGGYTTSQIYDSITAVGGSVVSGQRTRDGYLISTGGRADPNALYYVNGGGNDFLQLQVLNTAQAQAAAGRLVDSVEALQAAGARYIMVSLLPDVGNTPTLGGNAFFSGLANDLNTELVAQLRGINAQIIPLNNPLLASELLANPAIFGFDATQNLVGTCFDGCANVNPTWGISSATPDPSKLLFNDGVHPTTAVQEILADYGYSLLNAPVEMSLLPQMGQASLRGHQQQLRNEWTADWENWQTVGEWRGFLIGGGQHQDIDSQGADMGSADGNGYSFNLGTSLRLDEAWRIGAAVGYYQQDLDAGEASSDYSMDSYLGSLFAQYQQNRWWGDLSVSGGNLDYDDLKRKFYLGQVKRTEHGNTNGDLWAASTRLGYDIAPQADSQWHLSPFLSADYSRVNVDGFSEDGSQSTTLNFDDQQRDSRRLGAGLQGRYQLDRATAVFAEYSFQREYDDDATKVTAELVSLPGIDFELKGYTPGNALNSGTLGVSHQLTEELTLRGGYTYGKEDDQTLQGVSASLSLDF
ncbi:autotransporter outer membrane beta-barrel domain-containing protein [Pseudomonas sp. N040]|uniref:autotransporter outer membrane beta-barrel domain-containing protein n=1 Tax=Pseudomonas sp. N040 TaxID=2785325 RepID=UPI0018A33644|nr:autotransporter domain-containing SGNH/GDSL hydrolase family protein [Pseudomonas sp. N040]MBF7728563.1 autotransporter domain-containing protein [Pseudomonas sp. N040]MBW7012203.1 autotransporter domain-containing protein [Pseudomonas sp. N040]